ncbi:MAG: PAS domain S-box protein [Gammaproteobacteria bacterium]
MKQKKDWMQEREALRAKADQVFSNLSLAGLETKPAETMLHELLVHKFELEMQIEEQRRTFDELEEMRNRYLEYYEDAPVGYLAVDRAGRIAESNLAGAEMLGVERAALAGKPLAHFVSTPDQDRWHRMLMNIIEDSETRQFGAVLQMARPDRTTFEAYLDCRRSESPNAPPTVRVTLFDIGKIKQAEAER